MPEKSLKQRISTYVGHHGGNYSEWYIGLTSDPEMALFDVHKVRRRRGTYRHFRASEPYIARRVKRYYVEKGMCNGVRADIDHSGVYVYRITEGTVQ